jgi:hypothetical protein
VITLTVRVADDPENKRVDVQVNRNDTGAPTKVEEVVACLFKIGVEAVHNHLTDVFQGKAELMDAHKVHVTVRQAVKGEQQETVAP